MDTEPIVNGLISEYEGQVESEIAFSEGLKLNYYLDTMGIKTIGYGHNCVSRPLPGNWTVPITEAQAIELLRQDIAEARRLLESYIPWVKLAPDDARKGILIDLCFNMGIGKLMLFHRMLEDFRDGYFNDAAMELTKSVYATQVPSRCKRLATQMVSNQWQVAMDVA